MTVEATVEPHCLVAVTNVSFGPSDGTSVKFANGSVSITCRSGIQYRIALNGGLHPLPNVPVRTLRKSGTQTYLGYELYKDSGHIAIWGDGSTYPAGTAITNTSSSTGNNHVVYGKLNTFSTNVTLGGYSDIVNVTVTY
jgi:spore coat protein U-like protein